MSPLIARAAAYALLIIVGMLALTAYGDIIGACYESAWDCEAAETLVDLNLSTTAAESLGAGCGSFRRITTQNVILVARADCQGVSLEPLVGHCANSGYNTDIAAGGFKYVCLLKV